METAKRIRALGSQVNILFVTNYASVAIDGYGVGALDFVVKPVKDEDVARALTKLIEIIKKETGIVFSKVLEHAGVYKCNEQGLNAFEKFLAIL